MLEEERREEEVMVGVMKRKRFFWNWIFIVPAYTTQEPFINYRRVNEIGFWELLRRVQGKDILDTTDRVTTEFHGWRNPSLYLLEWEKLLANVQHCVQRAQVDWRISLPWPKLDCSRIT
jgi:hypothetical protein